MNTRRVLTAVMMAMAIAATAAAQFTPLQPGEAIVTCFSDNGAANPVVAKMDLRNPAVNGGVLGQNWPTPALNAQHPADWTLQKLGEVFGIALDDAPNPNIYVTSTIVYSGGGGIYQNAPGTGRVFMLNGTNGTLGWTTTLPNDGSVNGQGLGNIAYDARNKQLFVTNFYDGKIYRLGLNGTVIDSFDPFGTFNAALNTGLRKLAPLGERLWGVGVYRNEVYFAVWSSDQNPSSPPNTIWSVALTGGGAFTNTVTKRVTLPPNASGRTMPVADIEFSPAGQMFLAERGMSTHLGGTLGPIKGIYTEPHEARVLEYTLVGGTWTLSNKTFAVGQYGQQTNASGGVAYSCPLDGGQTAGVVATGNALIFGPTDYIYGLQIFPESGGSVPNSYLVDVDGKTKSNQIGYVDKTQVGDVDVYNTCEGDCATVQPIEILCATDGSGDYFVKLTIKNLTADPIYHVFLTNLSGGATATPNYVNLSSAPLAPGNSTTIGPIRIHGATGSVSFLMSIHNVDLEECCATRVVIELPDCDCAQITKASGPFCKWKFNPYIYNFTLQNLFPGQVGFVLITPESPTTATFSPNVFTTSIAQYGSGNFSIKIGNVTPGQQVCFRVSIHNPEFEECCSIRVCVTIPHCWTDWPFDIQTLGDSRSRFEADYLIIESPTKEPGVKFPLSPETTKVDLEWLPVGELPVDSYMEQRYEGRVTEGGANEVIAATRTTVIATGSELSTTFPALKATHYRYEFLLDGAQVGVETGVESDFKPQCNGCGLAPPTTDAHFVKSTGGAPEACTEQGYPCLFAGYTFPDAALFHLRANAYRVNEIRVYPEDGLDQRNVRLSALVFQARGPSRISFTHLGVEGGEPTAAPIVANLNTGYDQVIGALLPIGTLPAGTNDDDWKVVAPGAEQPAKVVIAPHPLWAQALDLSRWISIHPDRGLSPGATTISFERCFCLGANARDVTLDLRTRGDNTATVLLNGQILGGPGGAHDSATPLSIRRTGDVGDGLFVAGRNCLRVDVTDFGALTGLDVAGSVTASGGACALP